MKRNLPPRLISKIDDRKESFQNRLIDWFQINKRDFSWRKNKTPYSVLICEILLRRTTAQAVSNVYDIFLEKYPDISFLKKADENELRDILSKLGYHFERTKIFKSIASHIVERCGGEIPSQQNALLNIPHVGHYIANCILTFGYSQPTSIVDTNVERILKQYFSELSEIKTLRLIREAADLLAPKKRNQCYNYALLDLGGLICKSKKPRCIKCPICESCDFYLLQKG